MDALVQGLLHTLDVFAGMALATVVALVLTLGTPVLALVAVGALTRGRLPAAVSWVIGLAALVGGLVLVGVALRVMFGEEAAVQFMNSYADMEQPTLSAALRRLFTPLLDGGPGAVLLRVVVVMSVAADGAALIAIGRRVTRRPPPQPPTYVPEP